MNPRWCEQLPTDAAVHDMGGGNYQIDLPNGYGILFEGPFIAQNGYKGRPACYSICRPNNKLVMKGELGLNATEEEIAAHMSAIIIKVASFDRIDSDVQRKEEEAKDTKEYLDDCFPLAKRTQ